MIAHFRDTRFNFNTLKMELLMDRTINNRLNGLDTLRAVAIILVLIYHYWTVVSSEQLFGYITRIGWIGVDLFFVLSGYLIGDQILKARANEENFSLKNFYARRLLRTLPNYYVVLALYFALPTLLFGNYTAPLWQFFTFTQNFDMRPGQTFTHSWSLCVEEQFYLLFPLVALVAIGRNRSPFILWGIIALSFLTAITLRVFVLNNNGGSAIHVLDYYEYVYYPTHTRFDELLPGIALALIKNYHSSTYERLLRHGNAFFLAGLLSTVVICYLFLNFVTHKTNGTTVWVSALGYSGLAISFSLILLGALSPNSWIYKRKIPGLAQIAIWSYAIYLIHKPLYQLLKEPLVQLGINKDGYSGMALIIFVSCICGWLLYKLVEVPFMKLRARWVPSNNAT